MTQYKFIALAILLGLVFYPFVAIGDVGPGAGLTLIGSLIGAVVAIVLALGAILLWPLRKLIKKIKTGKQQEGE